MGSSIKTSNSDPWNATLTFPDGSVQKISKKPRKDKSGDTQYDETYETGGRRTSDDTDRMMGYARKMMGRPLGDLLKGVPLLKKGSILDDDD